MHSVFTLSAAGLRDVQLIGDLSITTPTGDEVQSWTLVLGCESARWNEVDGPVTVRAPNGKVAEAWVMGWTNGVLHLQGSGPPPV